jgi:predicted DNA-binding transcriptional regulator YafY
MSSDLVAVKQRKGVFGRRLSRCLRLLVRIQSGLGCAVDDLAANLGVSRRTIFRDLEAIEQAGITLRYDPLEGCRIAQSPRVDLYAQLHGNELVMALLALRIVGMSSDPPAREMLEESLSRILARVPNCLHVEMRNVLNSIVVMDEPALRWPTARDDVFAEILMAFRRRLQLRLRYEGESSPICCKVDPSRLVASRETWYLVGRSSWHRAVYRFDLRYITQAARVDNSSHDECFVPAELDGSS